MQVIAADPGDPAKLKSTNGAFTGTRSGSDVSLAFPLLSNYFGDSLENPNGDPLLAALARFHGLDNNIVQMLADCIAFAPKVQHVRDLLITVYGPNWLRGLEATAKRT